MGATPPRIRKDWDVQRSPDDKGWVLTMKVTAYDSGMISVDGTPINKGRTGTFDPAHGWLGAADVGTSIINEFRKFVVRKRRAN